MNNSNIIDREELPTDNDSVNRMVFYARKCAREAGTFLAEKTDEEIIIFALSYLGANIDDAIESGLAEVGSNEIEAEFNIDDLIGDPDMMCQHGGRAENCAKCSTTGGTDW